MRTYSAGTGPVSELWPETLTIPAMSLPAGTDADRLAQRIRLSEPLPLGDDPRNDVAALRFLADSSSQLIDVEWTLAGRPPWPVRTLVHLIPPSGGTDQAAREYADRWRHGHRFGLCSFRRGPDFVRLRDTRPDGPHRRILITEPWTESFDAIAEGVATADDRARQLAQELVAADLALDLDGTPHLLAVRQRRWPTPHPDRR